MKQYRTSKRDPVIIIGMHRSGTTMITEFLERLGLFVGDQKDDNCESLFFFRLNHFMFKVGVSKVDYPQNMLLMNPNCKEELANVVDYHLGSSGKHVYLGDKRANDIRDLDIPWGWKEPRNTFTLEIYKLLFPNARIIHIYRNPIDASVSYVKRDIERRNRFDLNWRKRIKRKWLIAHKYHQNFRLNDNADGYALWKEYVGKALSWEEEFKGRIKTYQYEAFLSEPFGPMKEMAEFCGLHPTDEEIRKVVANVDASRKYAFTSKVEEMEFYHEIRNDELMRRLGYDSLSDVE